jgi:hypothetical protein
MPYESFHAHFPEIAEKETRTITVLNHASIPKGKYGLIEMYCNELGCDCRRVFFDVYDWEHRKSMAIIAYGWESKEFYARWFGSNDPDEIHDLQGPVLNFGSPQSKFAQAFLALVEGILSDSQYVSRLKRHYQVFKDGVNQGEDLDNTGLTEGNRPPKKARRGRRSRHRL